MAGSHAAFALRIGYAQRVRANGRQETGIYSIARRAN
jgi:hypothetical protein